MYLHNLFRWIVVFMVTVLSSMAFDQTLNPTASLQYPFKKSDTPGQEASTLKGFESVKRCEPNCGGWKFTDEANYTNSAQGYTYLIYHPGWDMNVEGQKGSGAFLHIF